MLVRDLGIIYNNRFEFTDHVQSVVTNASKRIGFLKYTTKSFSNPNTLIHLYKTLVLPLLLFGSIIWAPQYAHSINRLESIQHKFLRYLSYKIGQPMDIFSHDYSTIARRFDIPTIGSLHKHHDLLFVHKCLHHQHLPDNSIFTLKSFNFPSRSHFILMDSLARSNVIGHSTTFRLRRSWNNLDDNFRCITNLRDFINRSRTSLYLYN